MIDIQVEDYDEMNTFIKEQKDLFFTNLILCIEKGWEEDKTIVGIAKFFVKKTSNTVSISIGREDWYESLHVALYHFEAIEDYEYCIEINELIDKMYIDDDGQENDREIP